MKPVNLTQLLYSFSLFHGLGVVDFHPKQSHIKCKICVKESMVVLIRNFLGNKQLMQMYSPM